MKQTGFSSASREREPNGQRNCGMQFFLALVEQQQNVFILHGSFIEMETLW